MRTYKRKLILTKAQEKRLRSWIGACRVVYNLGLEIKQIAYKVSQKNVTRFMLDAQLKDLRREVSWMKDVPFECLSDSVKRLDLTYSSFFKKGGFPKWASKKNYKSISFRQLIRVKDNKIRIPGIGLLKMLKDAPVLGDIKNATIKIEPTGFFVCIQCNNVPSKFTSENQAVGLDMGIASFYTDSNGEQIANPRHFAKYERKLRIENRSLARKIMGSASWTKQAKRLTLLHHKIGNVRKDFLHKESTKIAKANSMVYIEDLNVRAMSTNKNLSKHILDCGWGTFRTMLSYKTNVLAVNPAYTSQTCFECRLVDKKSRLNQSEFVCTGCGHVSHADINAAKNIMSKGIALSRQREAIACA